MLPDPKWLEALKLPLRVIIAIACSSGLLLILDGLGALDLDALWSGARPIAIIVFVASSALVVVNVADLWLAPRRERRRQAQAIARLDHLSKEEIAYVAECLRNGTPTFYTWKPSSAAGLLGGKGLVWTPGGQHQHDHYPFCFHDFAWKVILARRDEFIAKDDERKRAEEAAKEARRRGRSY